MPVPTSYSESELAAFMITELSYVAGVLNWTADSVEVNEAVLSTLIEYGVTDIDEATNIQKLRALGRQEIWKAAEGATSADFNYSADGGRYDRSQIRTQVAEKRAAAESAAIVYSPAYSVKTSQVSYPTDPYINDPDLEDEDTA